MTMTDVRYPTNPWHGRWRSRTSGLFYPDVPPVVDPDPPGDPGGWEDAITAAQSAGNVTPIDDWYAANTGHEANDIEVGDLTPGTIVSTADGQTFEGIAASVIRVAHNNVTIRNCRVTDGGLYGSYLNPTFSAPVTGLLIEHCTLVRAAAAAGGVGENSVFMMPAPSERAVDVTVRYCNSYGWVAGFRGFNKCLFEYNWIHDMQHPVGAHANAIRMGSSGGRAYRNYGTDGSSGVMSIYLDKEQTDSIAYEQNIMTGTTTPEGQGGPSYLVNIKNGAYAASAYNIQLRDNYWGPGYQYGLRTAGGVSWGSNGNEASGNRMLLTNELAGN